MALKREKPFEKIRIFSFLFKFASMKEYNDLSQLGLPSILGCQISLDYYGLLVPFILYFN